MYEECTPYFKPVSVRSYIRHLLGFSVLKDSYIRYHRNFNGISILVLALAVLFVGSFHP